MKTIEWEDKDGYKRRALVRDGDPEDQPEQGIQQGPPPLDRIDWEGVKRGLHNRLMDAGLFTWKDVQEKGDLRGIILAEFRQRLIYLYREAEHE